MQEPEHGIDFKVIGLLAKVSDIRWHFSKEEHKHFCC